MESAGKHLKGLVEVTTPSAGMFAWMKLTGVEDTEELVMKKCVSENVLLVPGVSFLPCAPGSRRAKSPYVRASYSTATRSEIDIALERLASLLKEEMRNK